MGNILLDGLMLVFLVLGLAIIWAAAQVYRRTQQLEMNGITVEGVVTGLRHVRGSKSSLYYVSYHLEVKMADGTPVTIDKTDETISAPGYASLSENGPVLIVYMPDNPKTTAQLSSNYGGKGFWGLASVGIGLAGAALIGFVFMLSDSAKIASKTAQLNATAASLSTAVSPLQLALSAHIALWKESSGLQAHLVGPTQLGLDPAFGITEIDYGRCLPQGFYIYATKAFQPGRVAGVTYADAYFYLENAQVISTVVFCAPENWSVIKQADLGGGWASGLVVVSLPNTPTPSPTPG